MLPAFGRYRLVAELGRGGMADVFLAVTDAQNVDFTKLVVVKKLREQFANDLEFVTMFLDEARIAARLNHPNVIQTLEVAQELDDFFLAMEFLDGQPLSRILRRADYGIDRAMHLTVLCEVLSGLQYAHDLNDYDGSPLNVVHRDVTPHNIFVTYDGQVKVMDFGIAKAAGRAAETQHGVIKGKVAYMSPEQVVATRHVDRRADVFAAGVMIYEACVRGRMWAGMTENAILRELVKGAIPSSPRARKPDVPQELDRICQKALLRDVEQRYPTAAALQADLEDYITEHEKRPSPRQIGRYVGEQFSQERETTRKIIEQQLSDLVTAKKDLVVIALASRTSSSSSVDVTFDHDASVGTVDSVPMVSKTLPPETTQTKSTKSNTQTPSKAQLSIRISALLTIAALALIVVAVGLKSSRMGTFGVQVWHLLSQQTVSPPSSIQITLRASPVEAHFQIDDGPLVDNPYSTKMPRDVVKHHIRAVASGYDSKVEDVVFDSDVSVQFVLSKRAP